MNYLDGHNPNILLRVKKLGRRDPSHCFIFPQRWLFSSFILLSLSSSLSISLEISLSSERVSDMWPPRALHRGGFLSCTRPTRKMKVKVAQLSPTLPNPMDYTVHGILQARILKWVTFPFSRGSSQSRDQTQVFRIAGRLNQLSHKGSPKLYENNSRKKQVRRIGNTVV